ncbi:XRE family transcriptional regulator [Maridesulfovibrio sp.]|uniref:XRE family transcriptional regulator n=1 Tax=Maridesulfovibrio sp. TaxID=2795000 RepID=UPI0039F11F12
MSKNDHTNSLENPAYTIKDGHELVICDECGEELVFSMQDNYHQFALGLRTVLYCLRVAETEGNIPPLPEDWWLDVDFRHSLDNIFKNYPKRE